jgi:hypothetical protein
MTTGEFPEENQAGSGQAQASQAHAGQTGMVAGAAASKPAEMTEHRARTVVLHNSRLVCWMTMGCGIVAVPMGICMVLEGGSLLFPLNTISFIAVVAAAQWILGGFLMCFMLPWAWKWGMRMLSVNVKMDARGVDLNLGTKKKPVEMFVAWDQLASVRQKRLGKIWEFTIVAKDGSWASYTTNSFFRSKHVARTIAERAGLTIQLS